MMPHHYRMPPVYVRLLMSLYCSPYPLEDFGSRQQVMAPVTRAALDYFAKHGLLTAGVTRTSLFQDYNLARPTSQALSPKGEALVNRICNTSLEGLE